MGVVSFLFRCAVIPGLFALSAVLFYNAFGADKVFPDGMGFVESVVSGAVFFGLAVGACFEFYRTLKDGEAFEE